VEDSDLEMKDLDEAGFPVEVIETLRLLTHKGKTAYLDYVREIAGSNNIYAKQVKLADLKHNSDLTRLENVEEKDLERIAKYAEAIEILEESLNKK